MFFRTEYKKFQALVKEIDINQIFEPEEIIAFKDSVSLINESVFIPKHKRKLMVVRIKKLITKDFNIKETTQKILEALRGKTEIRIGIIKIYQILF